MKIERHETGPRMSKAVIHGDTVYLAGIVADSPKGKSVVEQTKNILSQIDGFLAMAGTNKTKLLSANIWITDMAQFAEMNTVWDAWVSPGNTGCGFRFVNLLHEPTALARRYHHDSDLVVRRCEFGLNGRPCWRIARRYPGIPDRIHLSEIRHVGDPDISRE